jgi:hypothetical protein
MKSNYTRPFIIIMLLSLPYPALANGKKGVATTPIEDSRPVVLQNRLEEIKLMDRKELSKAEKKMLRSEVKQIKKELAAISGGVYLSVGAIILIALLLILLL